MLNKKKPTMKNRNHKIVISGGGTGGHVFPAISIARELTKRYPGADILFVGARDRMEMERVPAAGYRIVGLPVRGFYRTLIFKNIIVLFQLIKSLKKAKEILKEFQPDIVIGVGGYASGPVLYKAAKRGIPVIIQEQNSYAGVTNRLLSKKANKICVAYDGMEKYFPQGKIVLTGNPVRDELIDVSKYVSEAGEAFKVKKDLPVLLILGGSLGAGTINSSVLENIKLLNNSDVQVLWQTGKIYFKEAETALKNNKNNNIQVFDFIDRMELAYSVASLIISRAGACTISELCLVGKPVILVPSPNVAEDHQTKNALALVKNNAAVMIPDSEARDNLIPEALMILKDNDMMNSLGHNCAGMAIPDSAARIVNEADHLLKQITNNN